MNEVSSPGPDPIDVATDAPAVAPAPWQLKGSAVLLLFRSTGVAMPILSALALINYRESPVGPYGELIAGHWPVRVGEHSGASVEQIWVDSPASMVSGRANWGLGKELAQVTTAGRSWSVTDAGGRLIALTHRPWGPPLPGVKPAALAPLVQRWHGSTYVTRFSGRAIVRPTRIGRLAVDRRLLDLRQRKLVAAVQITGFTMTFPVP